MNSLKILFEAFALGTAVVVALYYFGWGAARWLVPASLREWRAWLTPFIGLALIVVWDYIALSFGRNLTEATLALLVCVSLLNAVRIFRERPRLWLPTRSEWGALAAVLVAFLAGIAPLVRYGYLTLIGENWDYEFYLPLTDALRTLPTSALAQAPPNPLMNVVLSRHILPLPMGFAYLQSSLDVLFRLQAFDSFAVLLAVVHALGVLSAFFFFKSTLKMAPRAATAAAWLLGLNGLLLWTTYWSYGLQLTSLALLPAALALGVKTILKDSPETMVAEGGRGPSPLPLAALFLAALNVTFHPALVAAALPLGLLGLYALSVRPARLLTVARGAALILLTLVLSFPTLFHVGDFLREYYGREPLATGLRDFVPLADGFGFSQYTIDLVVGHTIPTPQLYDLAQRIWALTTPALLALAAAASALALWQLRSNSQRRAVWYCLAGASIFYVALFRLPFLRPYPYGFLKSLSLVSFILIALVVQGISRFRPQALGFLGSSKFKVGPPIRSAVYGLLFLSTLFTFGITLEQYFKPSPPFFNADDLRIRYASGLIPRQASVFITDQPEVQKIPMALAAYAMGDLNLRGDIKTGYGDLSNLESGAVYDYALLARGEDPGGRGYESSPLWSNNKFALYQRMPGVLYHRVVNARVGATSRVTFTLGDRVLNPGGSIAPGAIERGVTIALASMVPQRVVVTLGERVQILRLAAGLSTYEIPKAQLPATLTISAETAREVADLARVRSPDGLPRADATLYVPWIELREPGDKLPSVALTLDLLVRCNATGTDGPGGPPPLQGIYRGEGGVNVRCFVANPYAVNMRWEYVLRGTPKGTREEQELVRQGVEASPDGQIEIGDGFLAFDNLPPNRFPAVNLKDGSYRAALEIFNGPILAGRADLYALTISQEGLSNRRAANPDPPLLIVQPN